MVGDLERDAIRLLARSEGIVLDPVYAGRAVGARGDLIRKGTFKRDVRTVSSGTPAARPRCLPTPRNLHKTRM